LVSSGRARRKVFANASGYKCEKRRNKKGHQNAKQLVSAWYGRLIGILDNSDIRGSNVGMLGKSKLLHCLRSGVKGDLQVA
jgi:hypothetical protein